MSSPDSDQINNQIMVSRYEETIGDYTQSANSLFHYMDKEKFLKDALSNKALFPRYFIEDISYLHINRNEKTFDRIAVLGKCFCDIRLYNLVKNSTIEPKSHKIQREEGITSIYERNNGHLNYYGKFALALSKEWGEKNGVQPVHYINEYSPYAKKISETINRDLKNKNTPKWRSSDILYQLALMKPLRGKFKIADNEGVPKKEIPKNFHDEQEWRYIPEHEKIDKYNNYKIGLIIANPHSLEERELNLRSEAIKKKQYSDLWLKFEYSDVRYLIVPNNQSKQNLIKHIISMPSNNNSESGDLIQEKYNLISKILVLNEIIQDW